MINLNSALRKVILSRIKTLIYNNLNINAIKKSLIN